MKCRGRGARLIPAFVPLLLATIAVACVPQAPPTPTPSPSSSPRLPTPVPTPFVSAEPSSTASAVPSGAQLVIRLATCSHTCGPTTGTSIYEDGRIIWADLFLRPLEGRLKPEALQQVRDALASTGVLDTDGAYQAQLRPGAEPVGRGATLHRFERDRGDDRVVVTSGDAGDFAEDRELWIVPDEVVALTNLAARLAAPVAWLGPAAFLEEAHPYEADRFLVMISAFEFAVDEHEIDADDVSWPWDEPIEAAGDPFDLGGEGPRTRCLALTAGEAKAMVEAEVTAGGPRRDLSQWQASAEYGWRRGGGSVTVDTIPLLPHQAGTCDEVFTFVGEASLG